jgi:phage/plasmid-like protein (TIGR03299 family)
MSTETEDWLNSNILVGFTEKNGRPWWFEEDYQPDEPTVYPGAIPSEDVERRIFNWEAQERPVYFGGPNGEVLEVEGRKAIVHGTTNHLFKIARNDYEIHQYRDVLFQKVKDILDDGELHIGSAGLLRRGAGAFMTVEPSENLLARCGLELKPRLLAATSHDSKLATTYKMVGTIVVCDNTLAEALTEDGPRYKARHTKNSKIRLGDIREALGLKIAASGEELVQFIDSLADTTVTESQWQQIVDLLAPIPEDSLPRVRGRLENKRNQLNTLWTTDERCAPWNGSALGVFQVFNTYRLHIAGGATDKENEAEKRFDRNMTNLLSGAALQNDKEILNAITAVTVGVGK